MSQRSIYCRGACLLGALVGLALVGVARPQDGGPAQNGFAVRTREFQSAPGARREVVRSAKFTWRETKFLARGSLVPEGETAPLNHPGPVPAEDAEFTYECTLWFDGAKLRFVENEPLWSGTLQAISPRSDVRVWNDTVGKTLSQNDPRHPIVHRGNILGDSRDISGALGVMPLTLHYDLGGERRPSLVREATPVGPGTIDDLECFVFERSPPGSSISRELWACREQDWSIRRVVTKQDGKVVSQLDVDYVRDAEWGWRPTEWKLVTNAPNGGLLTSVTATVTEVEINLPIAASEFELEFPMHALVFDHRANPPEMFVVLEGGRQRVVTQEEMQAGVQFEKLLETESGEALDRITPPRSSTAIGWVIAANVLFGVVVAWLLIARRRQRSRRP